MIDTIVQTKQPAVWPLRVMMEIERNATGLRMAWTRQIHPRGCEDASSGSGGPVEGGGLWTEAGGYKENPRNTVRA